MNRRVMLKQLAAAAALPILPAIAFAQEESKYTVIDPPQSVDTPGKIEVIEFFHYGCNHCRAFDPILQQWQAKLPEDVILRKIPATWGNEALKRLGQLYYTIDRTNAIETLNSAVFAAVQDQRLPLYERDGVEKWITGFDKINAKEFMETYDSFGVQSMVSRSEQAMKDYDVKLVPMLVVNGKYFTSPSQAGGQQGALEVVDQLIAKERQAKG